MSGGTSGGVQRVVEESICYCLAPTRLTISESACTSSQQFVCSVDFLDNSFVKMATGTVNTLTGHVHKLASPSGKQHLICQ